MTLGEMLIRAGRITAQQFDEALKHRVIYGGKIGTSLVELGYIHEEDLAQTLSQQLAVPYVDPSVLFTIPPETISVVSRELAQKYKAIPLSLERKKLSVVMADPSDLRAIDDIAFITGYQIEPVVTPEVRLMQALEKYYQIEIDPRYLPLIKKLAERKEEKPSLTPAPAPLKQQSPPPPQQKKPQAPQKQKPQPQAVDVERKPKVAVPEPSPLDILSDKISQAEDREEIADLLMKYVSDEFPRAALFIVRENTASGWRGVMMKMVLAGFERLQLTFDEPSILKVVAEGSSFYLGPIPENPNNDKIIKALGGGKPGRVLLLPLIIMGRVVNILYVEGKGEELRSRVPELQKILGKAAMAFEILILKNKIKMF